MKNEREKSGNTLHILDTSSRVNNNHNIIDSDFILITLKTCNGNNFIHHMWSFYYVWTLYAKLLIYYEISLKFLMFQVATGTAV